MALKSGYYEADLGQTKSYNLKEINIRFQSFGYGICILQEDYLIHHISIQVYVNKQLIPSPNSNTLDNCYFQIYLPLCILAKLKES